MSGLCVLVGVTSLVFAALFVSRVIPLSSGAFLISGGFEQLGFLIFVLYGAFMLLLAAALWKRSRWARRVAIVVAVIGVALAIPALSSAVMDSRIFGIGREGLQIIVRVVIVYYLSQEPVKDWFSLQ
jgi:hypothetical protein